ncbi:alkaline phosphatase synthesis sensor protein PhoR [Desulfosporosinus acididurans]|uniref:histidine kinase n=2 Tax=Desulfosporosinus acididurans TaxID=476652 RepID=A0A0J1FP87_9FIRM|nr:alkaline phosphatase synthesis sensor protein PhoR [Desulfosporosinus acididurans]
MLVISLSLRVVNKIINLIKNKLAFKLALSFIVIITICMITIGALFMQLFKQYAFESREKTMVTSARSIAAMASEVMGNSVGKTAGSSNPLRGFGGYLRSLDTITESKVWITDNKGNPAVISGRMQGQGMGQGRGFGYGARQGGPMGSGAGQGISTNAGPLPPEAERVIQDVLQGQESTSESFSSLYHEATITVGVPIFDHQHKVIGAVLLHTPVTGITSVLNKAVGILAVSLLVALLLAAALGVMYSILFTRPLKAMNRTALEITKGNYQARTGITRDDELGQLGNSLDLLARELGSTINQLFQEKGKLKDIISSISEGIIAFNINLEPVSVNFALADIMNRNDPYSLDDIDRDLQELEIKSKLVQVMKTKETLQILRTRSDKVLRFTISPIIDKHDTITGCVASVQDISENERLEQLRRDFVANVSHEFRTPLTVIRGYLEAMVDGTLDSRVDFQQTYQKMLQETHGLERLVKDLLELSQLQSGKISISQEVIHFPSLLEDTIKNLQTLADKKSIKLSYSIREEVPPFMGDYNRLRQLIIIFLDNAITHSPNNRGVYIETNVEDKNALILRIKDEGYGIAAEQLPHIWERFYKGDQSRNSKGTGLGLAIAKALIELLEGKIEIHSELNQGTRVTIKIPLQFLSSSMVE